jgi:GMP synthase (glutamine-hydrolysing)
VKHVSGREALMASTEYSAVENDPWVPSLLDYVKQAYKAEIPIAGFCYGHQIIARALGGQVTLSPGGYELGVQEVIPSSRGAEILGAETLVVPVAPNHDCIFTDLSQNIPQFHRDCVSSLPPNIHNLASSALCEVQVMYQKGRVLGYQGHPEFNPYVTWCLADLLLEQGAISQELFDSQVKGGGQPRGTAVLSKLAREFLLGLDSQVRTA